MFNATIIGNLTKNPELRTVNTAQGQTYVCDLDIAVNGRKDANGKQPVTYIRATAWRGLAEVVAKYCTKGRKVAITTDFMMVRPYTNKAGEPGASLECQIVNFEFVGGNNGDAPVDPKPAPMVPAVAQNIDAQSGFEVAEEQNELPF